MSKAFEQFMKTRRDHREGLTAQQQLQDAFRAGARSTQLLEVLGVIASLLEAPANRFGKLEFYTEEASTARRRLLEMAQAYEITPSHTILEQAAKVARAAIKAQS